MLLLGFMQGFPWILIATLLTLWLKEEGLSRSNIGLFSLLFSVYAVNLLWSPVVDKLRIAWLSNAVGQRKSWVLAMQAVIMFSVVIIASLDAERQLFMIALFCLFIATASATQDIALDALRIELFSVDETRKVAPASAMMTSGWWIGYGVGGGIALHLVSIFRDIPYMNHWQAGYLSSIPIMLLSCAILLATIKETSAPLSSQADKATVPDVGVIRTKRPLAGVLDTYRDPITNFVSRYGVRISVLIIAFIVLFKIGEAFLGRMSLIFYREVGFDESDIANYSKFTGAVSVCVFSVIGSLISARYGLFKGIVISGIAMALTNLLYSVLAVVGPNVNLFIFANVTDQFTTAVSTVAFVAFISQLCDRRHTATHYAALASLGNLSRTTLAAGSGFLADFLGGNWAVFFVLTTLMVLPSLALLLAARKRLAPFMSGADTKVL